MDIYSLIYNLLFITFLGLLVSFNPLLIVVEFLLILKTKRPIFNSLLLLAGFVSAISLLFFVFSMIIDPNSQLSFTKLKEGLDLPPIIDIAAGGLLMIFGIRKYSRPKASQNIAKAIDIKIPDKPFGIFIFGFVKAILSVSNIFAVMLLARQAVLSNWSLAIGFMAVIWLLIIGIVPLIYMMYLHWFKRDNLAVIDKKLNQLLSRDTTNLLAYGFVLIGIFFVTKGVFQLSN